MEPTNLIPGFHFLILNTKLDPTTFHLLLRFSLLSHSLLYKYNTINDSFLCSFSTLFSFSSYLFIPLCQSTTLIMEQFTNDDLEFVNDDYFEFSDFEDDETFSSNVPHRTPDSGTPDSDSEDDFDTVPFLSSLLNFLFFSCSIEITNQKKLNFDLKQQSNAKTDTSALEARNGKDIQGIPWEMLNYTRDEYRETRLKQYKNYESLPRSHEELDKVSFDSVGIKVTVINFISIFNFLNFFIFLVVRNVWKCGKGNRSMIFNLIPGLLNQQLCTFRQRFCSFFC